MSSKLRDDWLDPCQWQQAVELWRMGMDTQDIAFGLGVHESVIYNGLPWRRKEFEAAA